MRVLWIGTARREPTKPNVVNVDNGMTWHYNRNKTNLCEWLVENTDSIIGSPSEFEIKNGKLIFDENNITDGIRDFSHLVFTWNSQHLKQADRKFMNEVADLIQTKNDEVDILHPPANYHVFLNKSDFFDLMMENGYSNHIPEYDIIGSAEEARDFVSQTGQSIFKANNSSGGKNTVLVQDRKNAKNKYNGLKRSIQKYNIKNNLRRGRNRLLKSLSNKEKYSISHANKNVGQVIGVEQINNFSETYNSYISYRVCMVGKEISYVYPHVSLDNPIVHTDMNRMPNKKSYISIDNKGIKMIRDNYELFQEVRELVGGYFVAFDVLYVEENVIFLEPETKYGPGATYVNGHEHRYDLDEEYYNEKREQINADDITYENILSFGDQ